MTRTLTVLAVPPPEGADLDAAARLESEADRRLGDSIDCGDARLADAFEAEYREALRRARALCPRPRALIRRAA